MTTTNAAANASLPHPDYQLPDPPERHPDEVTSYDQLHEDGSSHHLIRYLGNPQTTLVGADRYIVLDVPAGRDAIRRYPDLFIAFNADRDAYRRRNGYVISEQGKPPDFVLEVASPSTGRLDVNEKRDDYAALGVPEYWRFDETGRWHGARLAGDRLENGRYRPIPIDQPATDIAQGYSPLLNVYLRWERNKLIWQDPATGQPILTYDDQLARALRAEAELNASRAARDAERVAREAERAARLAAEARVHELEERIRRLGNP